MRMSLSSVRSPFMCFKQTLMISSGAHQDSVNQLPWGAAPGAGKSLALRSCSSSNSLHRRRWVGDDHPRIDIHCATGSVLRPDDPRP